MLKRLHAGDVAWAPDLFHADDPTLAQGGQRPWLVISNDKLPGQSQGQQYVCLALTSNLAPTGSMLRLEQDDWERGAPKRASQVDCETLQLVKHHWMSDYIGRVKHGRVREARKLVAEWIR